MIKLDIKQLKRQAHQLKPIVIIGQHGITEAVMAEIERALYDHELIKIRLNADCRDQRQSMQAQICEQTKACLIQNIGHVITIYRQSDKPKRASS